MGYSLLSVLNKIMDCLCAFSLLRGDIHCQLKTKMQVLLLAYFFFLRQIMKSIFWKNDYDANTSIKKNRWQYVVNCVLLLTIVETSPHSYSVYLMTPVCRS